MEYIIYEPATKAEIRHKQITDDAIEANFLLDGELYDAIIYHPSQDKSAIPIIKIEPIYYNGMPTQGLDFGIFFTSQERAKAVESLPEDWNQTSNN